ncbi:TFIIB-type domain-containing protein [Entamoeba marina]
MHRPRRNTIPCESDKNPDNEKKCVPIEHHSRGFYICKYCDRVLEKVLYDGAEWRSFEPGDNERNRVTFVTSNDHAENLLKGSSAKFIGNDHASTKRNQADRMIVKFFQKLQITGDQIDHGKRLYKTLEENHSSKIKGKKLEPLILGIIYYVCKSSGLGKSFKIISEELDKDEKDIRKGSREISKLLGNQPSDESVETLVKKYCNNLNIGKYRMECDEICHDVQNRLEGKQPITVAAVIIFFVCRYHKDLDSQRESAIANQCKVSIQNVKSVLAQLNDVKDRLEKNLKRVIMVPFNVINNLLFIVI